jgi:hypothetical protein
LSKSIQKKLALYLSAMLLLNCSLLWLTRQSITQGLPDFTIFYTAAKILQQGDGSRLYDDDLQKNVQTAFSARGLELRGSVLPYNHPPFEALLFLPLAHFSYLTAYLLWLGINLALLATLPLILRPHLPGLRDLPIFLWMLASLAFFPIFASLIKGQDSVLLLFLYSLAFVGFSRINERAAGIWTSLGLFKYNLVLPFAISFVWRKRFLLSFIRTALVLLLLSVVVTGWTGLLSYPRYVWSAEHNPQFVWNNSDGNTPNLRGITSTLLSVNSISKLVVILACSFLVLFLSWRAVRHAGTSNPLSFAIAIVAAELVSYHAFVHDLSVLYLPILIGIDQLLSPGKIARAIRKTLTLCLLVFFCSPVYMVLMLRYGQLHLLGVVILVFFFTLLKLTFAPIATTQPA